jgi:hypothetical protein
MSPYEPTPKRLPLHSIARCDCPVRGPLVRVLRYEDDDVQVRSLHRGITYTTIAARLRAA